MQDNQLAFNRSPYLEKLTRSIQEQRRKQLRKLKQLQALHEKQLEDEVEKKLIKERMESRNQAFEEFRRQQTALKVQLDQEAEVCVVTEHEDIIEFG